jgi:hypothetical protein
VSESTTISIGVDDLSKKILSKPLDLPKDKAI